MSLDGELSGILPNWDRDREDLWRMLGPQETDLMLGRISKMPVRSVSIQARAGNGQHVIALDGLGRPQVILTYETFCLLMWQLFEEMLQSSKTRLLTAIRELKDVGPNEVPPGTEPENLARFLLMYVEMYRAWSFHRSATGHWRHGAHQTYNPRTLGKPNEGPKGDRDRRHLPLQDMVGGKKILDLGCGFGRVEEDLLAWGSTNIVALDISLNLLGLMGSYAEERGFSMQRIHRVQADTRRLPFRKGSFDMILAIGTIYQTPQPHHIVREVAGLLDGGQEAFLEFKTRNPRDPYPPRYSYSLSQYLSEEEVRSMLESYDLSAKQIYRIGDEEKMDHFYSPLIHKANESHESTDKHTHQGTEREEDRLVDKEEDVISKELLEILACPFCKHDIKLEGNELVSGCGLRYKIEDGIPYMLYPICPECKIEAKMIKENREFEFVCGKCGKTLYDKGPHTSSTGST